MTNSKKHFIDLIYPILFVAFTLIIEVITKITYGISLSKYFLLNISIILAIALVIYLAKNKIAQLIIFFFFLTVQIVLLIVNDNMLNAYNELFSLETLLIISEGVRAVDISFINLWVIALALLLGGIIITSVVLIHKKIIKPYKLAIKDVNIKTPIRTRLIKATACVMAFTTLTLAFSTNFLLFTGGDIVEASENSSYETVQNNDAYLYEKMYFRLDSYEKFGFYGFYTKNLINALFGSSPSEEEENSLLSYASDLTEGEKSVKYGSQANDNFITILMESVDMESLHPVLTPNLYAIANNLDLTDLSVDLDSYSMDNYYAKGKTNISEMGALLGTAPLYSDYTLSWNNVDREEMAGAFDFSLANKFKDLGYTTNYLINHEIDFYGRDNAFNEDILGFQNAYDSLSLDMGYFDFWGDWMPDSIAVNAYKDELFPADKPFYTHISTMVSHGPYLDDVDDLDENFLKIQEEKENGNFINPISNCDYAISDDYLKYEHYLSAVMDFDKMIGEMLLDLDEKGILDSTTIMLFADHETYYYGLANKKNNLELDDFSNPDSYHIPMYIISAKDESFDATDDHTIEKQVTFYDVYATICDLAGIPYLENICLGESVFLPEKEDEMRVFSSPTGGIFSTNIFTYDGVSYSLREGYEPTDEEIQMFYDAVNLVIFENEVAKYLIEEMLYPEIMKSL